MSSTAIIVSDAVFMGVSAASVGLRFYARKLSSEELAADDWLITVAWVSQDSLDLLYDVLTVELVFLRFISNYQHHGHSSWSFRNAL